MEIADLGLSSPHVSRFKKMGYSTLYPTQEEAVRTGFLEGGNIVVAVPTASGKTLLAYLAIARCVERGGRAVYVVPLKALAEEKYAELKELGVKVALSIGDYDSHESWLKDYEVVVTTSEKFDSLLRHETRFFDDITLLIADEVHLVHSLRRGPTLEVVLTKMRHKQIVALSATVSNAEEIASWLDAHLVVSDWRPVALKKAVYCEGTLVYGDTTTADVEGTGDDTVRLVSYGVADEGQVLVFVNSRKSTQAVARRIAAKFKRAGIEVDAPKVSDTPLGDELAKAICHGAAFHHAGMDRSDRTLVERLFREGALRAIVATPTLAAGINVPARRVIIRDWRRFDANRGYVPISNLEIQQMMGRAGRPKYDTTGEAILMAKSPAQVETLFDEYINSSTERITSKLSADDALRSHVLALCVPRSTREGLLTFFSKTLYAHQYGIDTVMGKVDDTVRFLSHHGLLAQNDDTLDATPLGARVSELYIDPMSGVVLRDALRKDATVFGMLHALCHTPDMPRFYLRKGDSETYDLLTYEMHDDFLVEVPDSWYEPEEYQFFLTEVKTAAILMDWISERSEREVCEKYDIGPGDLLRLRDNAEWICYAYKEIARVQSMPWQAINRLVYRIRHGVGEDLLELTSVKGIGRVRARTLYNLNIRSVQDLRTVPLERLQRILGNKTAIKVKQELGIVVSERRQQDASRDGTLE